MAGVNRQNLVQAVLSGFIFLVGISLALVAWNYQAHGYADGNLWIEASLASRELFVRVFLWQLLGGVLCGSLFSLKRIGLIFMAALCLLVTICALLDSVIMDWVLAWGGVFSYFFYSGPLAWALLGCCAAAALYAIRHFQIGRKALSISALLSITLVGLLFIGGRDQSGERPNLVVISVDALAARHLELYGYTRNTAPNLSEFAEQAVVFPDAYSQSSWTLPSHASMFTGLEPLSHGAITEQSVLDKRHHTLAEVLRNAGYYTAAFVDGFQGFFLDAARGLAQGFDVYDQEGGGSLKIAPKALEWLSRQTKPYFAFIHFYDVHLDYEPSARSRQLFVDPDYGGKVDGYWSTLENLGCEMHPTGEANCPLDAADKRHLRDLYDAEIFDLDNNLAALLGKLKEDALRGNTIVVLTSDHGTEFFQHDGFNHNQLYEESLRVPFVLHGVGKQPEPQRERQVWSVDLLPTVLDVLNLPAPGIVAGVSVFATQGKARSLTFSDGHRFGLRLQAWKLICPQEQIIEKSAAPTCELYNLKEDPAEKQDRWQSEPEIGASLLQMLQRKAHAGGISDGEEIPLDHEAVKRLKSLGYLQE